jgi:hypothetical protein
MNDERGTGKPQPPVTVTGTVGLARIGVRAVMRVVLSLLEQRLR